MEIDVYLDHSKGAEYRTLTDSQVVSTKPCFITFVDADCKTAASSAAVYNGISAAGELRGSFHLAKDTGRSKRYRPYMYCPNGVYVSLADTNIEVTIGIIPYGV